MQNRPLEKLFLKLFWQFPVVQRLEFTPRGPGLISSQGTKIPEAIWSGKKEKKTNYFVKNRDGMVRNYLFIYKSEKD